MDDLFIKEVDCAVHVTLDGVTLNDLAASLEVLEQCQQILDTILGILGDLSITPGSVTQYQFQRALSDAGLWDAAHDGLPDTKSPERIQWDTGSRTIFGDLLSVNVQTSTGLDENGMQDIYTAALAIPPAGT